MAKFKVGDRVRNVKGTWGLLEGGELGTVITNDDDDVNLGVEWDEPCGGHTCGCGKSGHCFWMCISEIELVKPEPTPEEVLKPIIEQADQYEHACWYCRKGGLVDLYLDGAMGICPSCGRVCNARLSSTPIPKIAKEAPEPSKPSTNKPLTNDELNALAIGTRVFTVCMKNGVEQLNHRFTCWRTVYNNADKRSLKRKNGFCLVSECNKDGADTSYHVYLEKPDDAVDSGK